MEPRSDISEPREHDPHHFASLRVAAGQGLDERHTVALVAGSLAWIYVALVLAGVFIVGMEAAQEYSQVLRAGHDRVARACNAARCHRHLGNWS